METTEINGKRIAIITGQAKVITDVQSALDLIMAAKYEAGTNLLAVDKNVIVEDFFVFSSGLAGKSCKSLSTIRQRLQFLATSPDIPA